MYAWANSFYTRLTADVSAAATSISVASLGDLVLSANKVAMVTLQKADLSAYEIVKVTAISGLTLTIERAQEETIAQAWSANDIALAGSTKVQMGSFESKDEPFYVATSGAFNRENGGNQKYTLTANEALGFTLNDGGSMTIKLSTSTFTPTIAGVGWYGGTPVFENNKTYLLVIWKDGAELEGNWDVKV